MEQQQFPVSKLLTIQTKLKQLILAIANIFFYFLENYKILLKTTF